MQLLKTMVTFVPEGTEFFKHAIIPVDFGHSAQKAIRLRTIGPRGGSGPRGAGGGVEYCDALLQHLVSAWDEIRRLNEPGGAAAAARLPPACVQSFVEVDKRILRVTLANNLFCFCKGASHARNGIYLVVDKERASFYQKCYDVDCRQFSSPTFDIPSWLVESPEEDEMLDSFLNDLEAPGTPAPTPLVCPSAGSSGGATGDQKREPAQIQDERCRMTLLSPLHSQGLLEAVASALSARGESPTTELATRRTEARELAEDTSKTQGEVLILVDYTLEDEAKRKECQSFAADLAGNLSSVLERKACVGVITFTENAIYQPTFLDAQNPSSLRSAVYGAAPPEQNVTSPDLHAALVLSERTFRFQDGGTKVVVLVSARESSSPEESVRMATKLKDRGVIVFVVSVDVENDMTPRRDKELHELAPSDDDYWFDITWPPNVSDDRLTSSIQVQALTIRFFLGSSTLTGRTQVSPNEEEGFSKVLPSAEPQAESAEEMALRAAVADEDLAGLKLALAEALVPSQACTDPELLEGAEALVKVLERRQELEEALRQWLVGQQDPHELRELLEEAKTAKASPALIRQAEEQQLKLRASEIEGWLIRATENEDSDDLKEWLEEADTFDSDAKSFNVQVDKLVVEEARLKLASASKLEEAEDALLQASQAEDVEAIALALARAPAAGVSPDRIQQAGALLAFLRKQLEAEEALRQAVAEQDVDEIGRLLEVARAVGSKGAILEEAHLMLESIRDSEEALRQAMRENNLRSLRKAVDMGKTYRALLAKVKEAEEQKAKLRAEAAAALEEAMILDLSEDLPAWVTELQEALTDALSVDASPEKVAEAQALLDKLRGMLSAEKLLREAMEGRDLDLIAQRLAEAREAGVNEDLLAAMEHNADVVGRLLKAMKDGYADDIAEILASNAQEAGLDGALLREAEEMIKSIRASEEELRRPIREQNMRSLRKVMRGVNMGKQLERMTNEHKELLAQLKTKAEEALRKAMQGSDTNELAECVDDAKSAGVVETLIEKAEQKLGELRLVAAAESALRQALQDHDVLLIAQRYREAVLV
ncbi:unnamed protein product [Polarella glacialis]|uniref:DNA-directed primase/polymerase protein n=1 Tax=Polarella glacialis TaxID=89957 RepID=A0A813HF35_POLGL|nr:unnamed protein product [Polarella glacialis]